MHRNYVFGSLLAAALAVTGCSVQTKHNEGNANANKDHVKIETPLGGMNVRTDNVEAKDTGMSVFPGSTPVERDEKGHDEKKANVNIDTPWFGVKVVALTYQSPESNEKVWEYYKKELAKYGRVLECRPGSPDLDIRETDDNQLTCRDGDKKTRVKSFESGKSMQLKVGVDNKQRIVAIKPSGSGTEYSLVFVTTRGEREML